MTNFPEYPLSLKEIIIGYSLLLYTFKTYNNINLVFMCRKEKRANNKCG